MVENLENINPKLYKKLDEREITAKEQDEDIVDEFDAREVFGMHNLKLILIFCLFESWYGYLYIWWPYVKLFSVASSCSDIISHLIIYNL